MTFFWTNQREFSKNALPLPKYHKSGPFNSSTITSHTESNVLLLTAKLLFFLIRFVNESLFWETDPVHRNNLNDSLTNWLIQFSHWTHWLNDSFAVITSDSSHKGVIRNQNNFIHRSYGPVLHFYCTFASFLESEKAQDTKPIIFWIVKAISVFRNSPLVFYRRKKVRQVFEQHENEQAYIHSCVKTFSFSFFSFRLVISLSLSFVSVGMSVYKTMFVSVQLFHASSLFPWYFRSPE